MTVSERAQSPWHDLVRAWVRIGLAGLVLIAALAVINPVQFAASLNWNLALGALAMQPLLAAATSLYAMRHAELARQPAVPFLYAIKAVILAAALNLILPGRLSETVKATYLRKSCNVPLSNGLAAIAIERLMDLVAVGVLAGLGTAQLVRDGGATAISILAIGLCAMLVAKPGASLFLKKTSSSGPVVTFLRETAEHAQRILSPILFARSVTLTIASWSCNLAAIWVFFAFQEHGPLSFSQVAIVFGAMILAGAIPGLPAGIGLVQAAIIVALQSFGFDFADAAAVSVVLHLGQLAISAIAGPVLLAQNPTGLASMMREAKTLSKNTETPTRQ